MHSFILSGPIAAGSLWTWLCEMELATLVPVVLTFQNSTWINTVSWMVLFSSKLRGKRMNLLRHNPKMASLPKVYLTDRISCRGKSISCYSLFDRGMGWEPVYRICWWCYKQSILRANRRKLFEVRLWAILDEMQNDGYTIKDISAILGGDGVWIIDLERLRTVQNETISEFDTLSGWSCTEI